MNLKFRRHFKLVALLALVVAVLIMGFGDQRIIAYTVHSGELVVEQAPTSSSDVALFEDAIADDIQSLLSDTALMDLYAH